MILHSAPGRARSVVTIFALTVAATLISALPVAAANATGIDVRLPAGHTIKGTITRQADATAVVGASVVAYSTNGFSYATTNGSGAYTLKGLGAGSYTIMVSTPDNLHLQDGYFTSANANHFTTSAGAATKVTIASANVTGKNMKLPADPSTYQIAGKVTHKSGGAPVANVEVTASGPAGSQSATTNANGAFKVKGLLPGQYALSVDAPDGVNLQSGCYRTGVSGHFTANCTQATKLTITNANLSGKNVALPDGLTMTGVVKDRSGNPVVSASVSADSQNNRADRGAVTNGTGHFTIVGLSPGSFEVEVGPPYGSALLDGFFSSANSFHWVGAAGSATLINLSANKNLGTIKPNTGFSISGTVTDSGGTPLQYATLTASGANGYGSASTAADGTYTIVGLAAGSYTIAVNAPYTTPDLQDGWYRSGATGKFTANPSQATSVTVGPSRTGVNVKLPAGYSISGQVTKSGGTPVTFDSVIAHGPNGRTFFVYTDGSGNYLFQGLPAGSFTIEVGGVIAGNLLGGFYKAGAGGNYTASAGQATSVTIGP